MGEKNSRFNVTVEKSMAKFLTQLARQERKPVARLFRELAFEALELREDFYLSKLAEELDQKSAKTEGHDTAWQ